ncbi:MAG: hypothetical protein ACTHKF_02190 [Candidatus Nitrosocosmicus sp.]
MPILTTIEIFITTVNTIALSIGIFQEGYCKNSVSIKSLFTPTAAWRPSAAAMIN